MSISKGQWAYVAMPRTETGKFLTPFFCGHVLVDVPSQKGVMTENKTLRDLNEYEGATRVVLVPALGVDRYIDYPTEADTHPQQWRLETQTRKVWVRK